MNIIYEGKDITDYVTVRNCVVRDGCGERCDSIDIEFEDASDWKGWDPQKDDTLRITEDSYDSGTMYLNTITPEDTRWRILAASLPCAARVPAWQSFTDKTIGDIARACAGACGMGWQSYGLDEGIQIPYLQRQNIGAALFLHRLMEAEGAVLKCINGKFSGISLEWANQQAAHQKLGVENFARNAQYKRVGESIKSLTVKTPYAEGTAAGDGSITLIENEWPAMTAGQAARWAKGLLTSRNRKMEQVTMYSEFNPGLTAMTRIDIEGDTAASGQWLIDEVEHDLINHSSVTRLLRCM